MRIFILTLGTRGDLELFLILGRELRRRGHTVVLGTTRFHAERVGEAQLECVPMGNGTQDDVVAILRSLSSVPDKHLRTALLYQRWLQPLLAESKHQITTTAGGADYFISNLKMVLRRQGAIVPGAAVTYDPPGDLSDLPRYGTQDHHGRILDLVAMNRRLIDPEGRWDAAYRFTGFWKEKWSAPWNPPPGLVAFLEQGMAPVVITMGSMVMFDTDQFIRVVTKALQQAAQRAILAGGWSGISPGDLSSDQLYYVSEVPYDWLFPQASCVIHHGGCGTVAAVLRAGIPSIVLPQIACQEHFARMLAREKLVTGVFDIQTLAPHALTTAIDQAVTDGPSRQSAQAWQKAVREDQGVTGAADLIEAHWRDI
jgi:UDP:flavonoid glycosyltransferase YjiC (YdhE family)